VMLSVKVYVILSAVVMRVVAGVMLPLALIQMVGCAASTFWTQFIEAIIPTRRKAKTRMLA